MVTPRTITNADVLQVLEGFQLLLNEHPIMPAVLSFRIRHMAQKLEEYSKIISEVKETLIEKFGKRKADGQGFEEGDTPGSILIQDDKVDEFHKEYASLLEETVTLPYTIHLSDLNSLGPINYQIINLLYPVIVEDTVTPTCED